MLRKLKLYGELAEFVGHKEFEIEASNIPKVMSFLVNNFPQVEQYMNPKYYQVKVGDYAIDKEELCDPIGATEDVHIVPVIAGAGSAVKKILFGAALIGISFFSFGTSAGLGVAFTKGFAKVGLFQKGLAALGGALILSGVSDMLFPTPTLETPEDDPRLSFNFAGTQNTSRAGTPVPIVYGEIFTGSVVISGAIDTDQVKADE